MGRHVDLRPNWNEIKDMVMLSFIRAKFEWPDLRKKLIDTGDAYLEEGNDWGDRIWGVCDGVGENRLGKILMQVRDEINNGTYNELRYQFF